MRARAPHRLKRHGAGAGATVTRTVLLGIETCLAIHRADGLRRVAIATAGSEFHQADVRRDDCNKCFEALAIRRKDTVLQQVEFPRRAQLNAAFATCADGGGVALGCRRGGRGVQRGNPTSRVRAKRRTGGRVGRFENNARSGEQCRQYSSGKRLYRATLASRQSSTLLIVGLRYSC